MNTTASLDLPLDIPLDPNRDPAPQAVWLTIFAPTRPHVTFAQAMADQILAHSIAQVSLKRARRIAGLAK